VTPLSGLVQGSGNKVRSVLNIHAHTKRSQFTLGFASFQFGVLENKLRELLTRDDLILGKLSNVLGVTDRVVLNAMRLVEVRMRINHSDDSLWRASDVNTTTTTLAFMSGSFSSTFVALVDCSLAAGILFYVFALSSFPFHSDRMDGVKVQNLIFMEIN